MAGDRARRSSERGTLVIMIAFFALMFGGLVTSGWARIIAERIPNPYAHWLVGAIIALVAIMAARMVGYTLAARRTEEVEDRHGWAGPALLSLMLLTISFFGTVNALFYYMEGGNVLQESVDDAQDSLSRIQTTAHESLLDPAQEQRRAAVSRLLTSLREEIVNPHGGNTCGVGPAATQIIQEMGTVLPGFRSVSQRAIGNACDQGNAEAIYRSYENQAQRILGNDPEFVRAGGPQKQAYLNQLDQAVRDNQARLRAGLAGISGLDLGGGYEPVKQALEGANNVYLEQRQQLRGFAPEAAEALPAQLDLNAARGLGSWSHILPALWERRDQGSTYFYIAVAILFDALLVALFAWHAALGQTGAAPVRRRQTDPHFLWVNQAGA